MLKLKQLKVKIKSLAAEARIIRLEELRSTGVIQRSLHFHRTYDVRNEARWSQLAYAFLRGRDYAQVEAKSSGWVNWDRVMKLVAKFGEFYYDCPYKDFEQRLNEQNVALRQWIDFAKLYRSTSGSSKNTT